MSKRDSNILEIRKLVTGFDIKSDGFCLVAFTREVDSTVIISAIESLKTDLIKIEKLIM